MSGVVSPPAGLTREARAGDTRSGRPEDGSYVIHNLPAGEHFITALTDFAPGDTSDQAFLAEMVPAALRVTVTDGMRTMQSFRIGTP